MRSHQIVVNTVLGLMFAATVLLAHMYQLLHILFIICVKHGQFYTS